MTPVPASILTAGMELRCLGQRVMVVSVSDAVGCSTAVDVIVMTGADAGREKTILARELEPLDSFSARPTFLPLRPVNEAHA